MRGVHKDALFLSSLLVMLSLAFVTLHPYSGPTGFATHPQHSGFSVAEGFSLSGRVVSASDTAVYRTAYYAHDGDAGWTPFQLSGEPLPSDSAWVTGDASYSLPASFDEPGEHYVIAYSCSYSGGWDCHDGRWQLRVVSVDDPFAFREGFEDGLRAPYLSVTQNGGIAASSTYARTGSRSLRLTGTGTYHYTGPDAGAAGVVADLSGGEELTYSVWVRGDGGVQAGLMIMCLNDDLNYWEQGGDGSGYEGVEVAASGSWQQLSVVYECPSWASHVGLRLSVRGSGQVWFDDAALLIDGSGVGACTPSCAGRECGGDGCGGSCGTCSYGSCVGGSCQESPVTTGGHVVVYENDFEQHPAGSYDSQEYLADWTPIPFIKSEDNTPLFAHSSIVDEGGNKVFRHDFRAGSLWCNDNGCFRANNYLGEGWDELYLSYRIKVSPGWYGSKGKIPSLNGYLTDNPTDAGSCVTGVDSCSARMMFFGRTDGIGLHYYPYHMGNWKGDFYTQAMGYEAESCEEVMEYVCDNWFCFDGVWDTAAFQGQGDAFVAAYGREPRDALEFAAYLHPGSYDAFLRSGRPATCLEFALYVREQGWSMLCGVYSGSGREVNGPVLKSGVWYTFTERVVANDVGQDNGFVEVFIDGVFVDRLDGLEFRATPDLKINNIGFDGYFGGSEADVPKNDVVMYIDDVKAFYFTADSGEPLGQERSSPGRVLADIDGGGAQSCTQSCAGRECGGDGCGGSCGTCSSGICTNGQCVEPTGSCISYDGACGSGCSNVEDADCFAQERPGFPVFTLKDEDDYSSKVYIDPTYSGTSTGSMSQPYRSWRDVPWRSDTAYLQKRGTTSSLDAMLTIPSTVSDIYLGGYGTGARPVISGGVEGRLISIEAQRALFRGLEVRNPSFGAALYFRGNAVDGVVYDCVVRDVGHTGVFSWADGFKILHSEIFDVYYDGLWVGNSEDVEIAHNHIYRVNRAWDVYGDDQDKASGDAVQLQGVTDPSDSGVDRWWVHDNLFDRSDTGNKFCFHASGKEADFGLFERNTLYGPAVGGHGGAGFYIGGYTDPSTGSWVMPRNVVVRDNLFVGPAPHGIWTEAYGMLVQGNGFQGQDVAIYNGGDGLRIVGNTFTGVGACFVGGYDEQSGNTGCP